MQLSAHRTSARGALPGGLAEEERWGGDLMDVNADADDWSTSLPLFQDCTHQLILLSHTDEFESAPAESGGANAVGGWRGASDDEDPWAAFEDPAPPPVSIPVTELTSPPVPATPPASVLTPARTLVTQARPSRVAALSRSPSPRVTPLASPATNERATSPVSFPASVPGTAGMTKEEKAAEMARRKEERKQVRSQSFVSSVVDVADDAGRIQRIAQLKEQKKNASGAKT